MFYLRLFILILLSMSVAVAKQSELETGAQILIPFKNNLQQALLAGLAESPEQAIRVCSFEAPEIAESLSQNNVSVGRTSDRLRSPSNQSPDWVRPLLETYLNSPSDRTAKTVDLANNKTGYVEPITLQAVCFTCHGETLSADISNTMGELYPDDQATGYQVGDLRGVFWVTY